MNRNDVNTMLRRNLKKGASQYDKFIKSTSCKPFDSGKGTAIDIIKVMLSYAQDHAHQVEKLANHLKTSDLKTTVDKFYQFQRDYIQYDVDGYAQRLRTPSCAWHNRLKGMDCKSFTIFSSALCTSAGLYSYMRQIKQASTGDRISHVYTIVPIDQKTGSLASGYYVLDGSGLQNVEPLYTWKNDMKVLPYTGMNAPLTTTATSCGCGMNAVASSSKIKKAYKNLIVILTGLVKQGASSLNMQKAGEHVYYELQSGKEPYIELSANGIKVNDKYYSFNFPVGMNSSDPFSSPAPGTDSSGSGFDFGSLLDGLLGGGSSNSSSSSSSGSSSSGLGDILGNDPGAAVGGAVGAGVGLYLGGPLGGALGGAVGGTLGSVVTDFGAGTGACGLTFENERLKGNQFFHNRKLSLKWRDAQAVLNFAGESLEDYGWRTNDCPRPAQGIHKRAEDKFFEVLDLFLDAVLLGNQPLPESMADDDLIIQYLQARNAQAAQAAIQQANQQANQQNNTNTSQPVTGFNNSSNNSDNTASAGFNTKTALIALGVLATAGGAKWAYDKYKN